MEIKNIDDIAIFNFGTRIDMHNSSKLKREIVEKIEEKNYQKIIFNLRKVDYIDSSGIGVLLRIITKLQNSSLCRFCEVSSSVLEVIFLSGLHNMFKIDNTEKDALDYLKDKK